MPATLSWKKLPFDSCAHANRYHRGSLLGLFLGWWVYGRRPLAAGQRDPLEVKMGALYTVLKNKYYIDEIYNYVFVQPVEALCGLDG